MPEQNISRPNKQRAYLFPEIEPFRKGFLDSGDGHKVYYEECGNPNGIPVLVVHGGPGGGCSPTMRRFFDPTHTTLFFLIKGVAEDPSPMLL